MATGKRVRGDATRALAGEIKAERNRRKMRATESTQRWLAHESGIAFDTIKSIETGRTPIDVDQLFAIADALNVAPSLLVQRAESHGRGQVTSLPADEASGHDALAEAALDPIATMDQAPGEPEDW